MTHLLLIFICLISACSPTQTERIEAEIKAEIDPGKTLIVYLSRTNNTMAVAEIIQKQVGGTLAAIELQNPYPENYQATVEQVASENESGFLPPLKTKIAGIEKYNVVFIGFPTWGMKLRRPLDLHGVMISRIYPWKILS